MVRQAVKIQRAFVLYSGVLHPLQKGFLKTHKPEESKEEKACIGGKGGSGESSKSGTKKS